MKKLRGKLLSGSSECSKGGFVKASNTSVVSQDAAQMVLGMQPVDTL
jgi:hypothetical protein